MRNAIVLGGTHDHIRLVDLLKGRGYQTTLVDYYEHTPAGLHADERVRISTRDREKVLELARRTNASLVISACVDSSLATAAYVSEVLGLPCHISYETALSVTNKSRMKAILEKIGVPTSRHYSLGNGECFWNEDLSFPLVVKPVDANSSKGVTKVNSLEDLAEAVNLAREFSSSGSVIAEEFKEGSELSVDAFIADGRARVVLVTENMKSSINRNCFTIVENRYPVDLSDQLRSKIAGVADGIAGALGIKNAPLLIQLILRDGEITVIEFSSRIGGGSKHHFIKRTTGFDMLGAFLDAVFGMSPPIHVDPINMFACVHYLYAKPGRIRAYEGFDELKNRGVIEDYYIYKIPQMTVDGSTTSSDRPAGLLVVDDHPEGLTERIETAYRRLSIVGETMEELLIK